MLLESSEVRCMRDWREGELLFYVCVVTFIMLFKSISVEKIEFLFDNSNVSCKAGHMAV